MKALEQEQRQSGLTFTQWYRARDGSAKYKAIKDELDQWSTQRDGLLLDLRMAAEGFIDKKLRQELWWSNLLLQSSVLLHLDGRNESNVREHLCEHMLRCIESSVLGEGIPEPGQTYQKCLDHMVRFYSSASPQPDPT